MSCHLLYFWCCLATSVDSLNRCILCELRASSLLLCLGAGPCPSDTGRDTGAIEFTFCVERNSRNSNQTIPQTFESTTWTWKRAEDFILYLITSIISVAEALLILKEQVFLITFWKFTIPGGFFIAIESTSRYTGLSKSEVLVLLGYAFALYGFLCNSDWMDANEFEMVNSSLWVQHGGLSC